MEQRRNGGNGNKQFLIRYGKIIKDFYCKGEKDVFRVRIFELGEKLYYLEEMNGEVVECERLS